MKNSCDLLFKNLIKIDNSLGDLRLKNAVYDNENNLLRVNAVSDVAVTDDSKKFVIKKLKENLGGIDISVNISKSVCDKDIAKKAIIKYLKEKCFSVVHLISDDSVTVFTANKKVVFEIALNGVVAEFFQRTSQLTFICEYLSRHYSNDFEGKIRVEESVEEEIEYNVPTINYNELEQSTDRYVKMDCVTKYSDDVVYDTAIYIEDGLEKVGSVYFAGRVISKEEKISKNNNPYYIITIDDLSGRIEGKYFTKDKAKLKKLEKIDVGSIIILRGENELYNGRASLLIKGYHLCEFPNNYRPQEKPSKRAPTEYSLVFPEKIVTTKQSDFLTEERIIPKELKNGVYSVVDIETTGTDVINDKITEIAVVKIVNGEILESFQTLINPETHIPERIVELTGIDDKLVENSPTIDKVYPDFFKFVENTIFVAHNAEFDYRFLKNKGLELGYRLNLEVLDTLALSRKVLPQLKHHKLNNVCDYYGITFRHHRALSDALATSELLLELVKGKKSLKEI
ncbi:MAG: hypothetical protein J6Q38_05865 [Clostridia bacterium]|nr:hypothetical protein [Clostridia bacterium]